MANPSASTVLRLVDRTNPKIAMQINADGSVNFGGGGSSGATTHVHANAASLADGTDASLMLVVNADGSVKGLGI